MTVDGNILGQVGTGRTLDNRLHFHDAIRHARPTKQRTQCVVKRRLVTFVRYGTRLVILIGQLTARGKKVDIGEMCGFVRHFKHRHEERKQRRKQEEMQQNTAYPSSHKERFRDAE